MTPDKEEFYRIVIKQLLAIYRSSVWEKEKIERALATCVIKFRDLETKLNLTELQSYFLWHAEWIYLKPV